ncbi:MAG: SH3 domain-containing protein [Anaerolineae bacterium]|nr:SH3 domain-containing protein [Anaerolineae bacterium]MBN8618177.1 SH3 domain-containing protein [Anaerolineae bacterium]
MMRYVRLLLLLIVLTASACNLSTQPPTTEPDVIPTTDLSTRPEVAISSPSDGDEVAVGTQVFVNATATDTIGVTRMQLIANNQIVKTVSSESPSGQQSFQVLLDYTPRQAGDVNLQVVAYRGAIASDPASVDIIVKSSQALVTATIAPVVPGPSIDPNDPTCRALTNTGLNLRTGPGTNYDRITLLPGGAVVPIIGRIGDNSWWQVRYGINVGWISAQYTSVYGICTSTPIISPPPSPTPTGTTATPTPTATRTPTATPSITVTPGKADLIVANIVGPTSTTIAASPVTYAVTITNTGTGPSGTFSSKVALPDGTQGDLGVVSTLSAGESITLNIDITFTTTGSYTMQVQVDSSNQVDEVSEVNNIGTLLIAIS